MITEELLKYIENERKSGKDDARIRATLVADSWTNEDIDEAFDKLRPIVVPKPNYQNIPQEESKPQNKKYLWHAKIIFILNICLTTFMFFGISLIQKNDPSIFIISGLITIISFCVLLVLLILSIVYAYKLFKIKNRLWGYFSLLPLLIVVLVGSISFVSEKTNPNSDSNISKNYLNEILELAQKDLELPVVFHSLNFEDYGEANRQTIRFYVDGDEQNGLGFAFHSCLKDDLADKKLKSYFDNKLELSIKLPEELSSNGFSDEQELYFSNNHSLLVYDKSGLLIKEFEELNSRCKENTYSLYTDFRYKPILSIDNIDDLSIKNSYSESINSFNSEPKLISGIYFWEKTEYHPYNSFVLSINGNEIIDDHKFEFLNCSKDETILKNLEQLVWKKKVKVVLPKDLIKYDSASIGNNEAILAFPETNDLVLIDENGEKIPEIENLLKNCTGPFNLENQKFIY